MKINDYLILSNLWIPITILAFILMPCSLALSVILLFVGIELLVFSIRRIKFCLSNCSGEVTKISNIKKQVIPNWKYFTLWLSGANFYEAEIYGENRRVNIVSRYTIELKEAWTQIEETNDKNVIFALEIV